MGLRVWGYRVWGLGFRVLGLKALAFRVWFSGLGCDSKPSQQRVTERLTKAVAQEQPAYLEKSLVQFVSMPSFGLSV